jgi:hypothetical protein
MPQVQSPWKSSLGKSSQEFLDASRGAGTRAEKKRFLVGCEVFVHWLATRIENAKFLAGHGSSRRQGGERTQQKRTVLGKDQPILRSKQVRVMLHHIKIVAVCHKLAVALLQQYRYRACFSLSPYVIGPSGFVASERRFW